MDLLRAYSNRRGLLSDLVSAVESVRGRDAETPQAAVSVRSARAPRVWKLRDRLAGGDVAALVSRYQAGTTARELAGEFGVGLSSVKRLLREHGVRREGGTSVTDDS